MKKFVQIGGLLALLTIFSVSTSFGADQQRDREQKKDGSCQTEVIKDTNNINLSADQVRDKDQIKDQKKDGSCND